MISGGLLVLALAVLAGDYLILGRKKAEAERLIEELHGEHLKRSFLSACPYCRHRVRVFPDLKKILGKETTK